jgi:hypothetical protein
MVSTQVIIGDRMVRYCYTLRHKHDINLLRTARKNGRQTANGIWMEDANAQVQEEILDDVTFGTTEMNNTVAWCKAEMQKNYLTVKSHRSRALRGAFRTFLKNLIGDASIGYGIMRHGCFSAGSLRALIREWKEKKKKRDSTQAHTVESRVKHLQR